MTFALEKNMHNTKILCNFAASFFLNYYNKKQTPYDEKDSLFIDFGSLTVRLQ